MKYISDEPCIACGHGLENEVCYHHLTSRKAGGSDDPSNLLPVCKRCHMKAHESIVKLFNRYPSVRAWLEDNGREDVLAREFK